MNFRNPYALIGSKEFVNNPGNGISVPQFYLDKETMTIRKKLDKNNKQIVSSLYDEIQMYANVNDYKKLIERNNGDLSSLGLGQGAQSRSDIDLTKFDSKEALMNASARLSNQGVNTESLWEKIKNVLIKHKEQQQVNPVNQEVKQNEGVKENEIKK